MSEPKDRIFIYNKDGEKPDVLTYIRSDIISDIIEELVGGGEPIGVPVKVTPISDETLYAIYGKKYKARQAFGYFLDGFRMAEKYHGIGGEK